MLPIDNVLERLDRVRPVGTGQWMALCPAHADQQPSLSIAQGEDGRVLINCFANCDVNDVCRNIGLEIGDLFPPSPPRNGPTYQERANTIPKSPPLGEIVCTYDYTDAEGKLLFQVVRYHPKSFRQRKPDPTKDWTRRKPDPAKRDDWIFNLRGVPPVLYRLKAVLEAKAVDKLICIVEGEKDADLLAKWGICTTTNAMGAGKWDETFTETLSGAHVVIIPDNDTAGRVHSQLVAKSLHRVTKSLRVLELPNLPEKGDVSDWIEQGGTPEELTDLFRKTPIYKPTPSVAQRMTEFTDDELLDMVIPPMKWAVPGLIAEGVTLLVGSPKIGKSWIVLDLALAVSQGKNALGKIPVKQGEVLYLALEDTAGRLQTRYLEMAGDLKPTGFLHFCLEFDPFGTEGGRNLEDEIKKYPNLRIVIVDTLAKIKRAPTKNNNIYKEDYEAIYDLKRLADLYGVSIVIVHHQKKGQVSDAMEAVSGSAGLTGAADAVVLFRRNRNEQNGKLLVMGRDVEEQEKEVVWDDDLKRWTIQDEIKRSEEREEIIEVLRTAGGVPLSPATIAERLGKTSINIRKMLLRMKRAGDVIYSKSGYLAPEK